MKKLFYLIFVLLISDIQLCQCQINKKFVPQRQFNSSDCNQRDDQNKKCGLWIENDGLIESYYKNDLRNGVFIAYNKTNGGLRAFGVFLDNKKIGTWYYFNESNHLILIEKNVEVNVEYKRTNLNGNVDLPKYTSYAIFYYPTGQVKEEGRVLYYDDIEIDYYKTGTWKYYDETGKLIKTENKNE